MADKRETGVGASRPTAPARAAGAAACVVVEGWPRISTTFIAQELVGLEHEGVKLWLASFGRPDKLRHSLHDQLRAPVHRLPNAFRHPLRVARAWQRLRRRPGLERAWQLFRDDMRHEPSVRRINDFGRALVLAAELSADVGVIYAHFIKSAAAIGRYAAAILDLPFTASAHAKDIWTTSEWDKKAKLAEMRWITTCTGPGADYLTELAGVPAKVHLIRHGLSLSRFPADPPIRPPRDGSSHFDPVLLLTVGRAVEKKGFDVLIDALGMLPGDLSWRLHHVGYGKLISDLKARADGLGIGDRIEWHGAEEQASVIARYRACDLFVLPSREGADGDRDGLPNVLMEAQSQALACLSTNFSAIPELIVDGETGVLVPPGDAAALSAALERLIRSPEERERLGTAGYARVRRDFQAEEGIRKIAGLLRAELARAPLTG
jgi:glycosyltransferase involved in cell wall biosynthesis